MGKHVRTVDHSALIGKAARLYGTGRLAKRSTAVTIEAVDGHMITVRAPSGNAFTVTLSRLKVLD